MNFKLISMIGDGRTVRYFESRDAAYSAYLDSSAGDLLFAWSDVSNAWYVFAY